LLLLEHAAADTEHHLAVPLHEGCEGAFLAVADEAIEQLTVGESVGAG
jgi:hypothetical protein